MRRRHGDVLGRLYVTYHEANERHFAGLLPMLPIYIENCAGRRAKTVVCAYLWSDDYTGAARHIVFDETVAFTWAWPVVRDTMLHEMIHVWQAQQGRKVDHGAAFKRMARRLGISERAVD